MANDAAALDVHVSTRGAMSDAQRDLARDKIARLVRLCREPVRLAQVRLVVESGAGSRPPGRGRGRTRHRRQGRSGPRRGGHDHRSGRSGGRSSPASHRATRGPTPSPTRAPCGIPRSSFAPRRSARRNARSTSPDRSKSARSYGASRSLSNRYRSTRRHSISIPSRTTSTSFVSRPRCATVCCRTARTVSSSSIRTT